MDQMSLLSPNQQSKSTEAYSALSLSRDCIFTSHWTQSS